jgi:hypothetical protein
MTKKCATEGCMTEIQEWQTYCQQHYAEMQQKQQMPPQQPIPPETPEVVKKEEVVTQPLPELVERERLIVKQTCLKSAVELMKSFDNEAKEFDQLMKEVETLTVYFYRTIVTKNEELS